MLVLVSSLKLSYVFRAGYTSLLGIFIIDSRLKTTIQGSLPLLFMQEGFNECGCHIWLSRSPIRTLKLAIEVQGQPTLVSYLNRLFQFNDTVLCFYLFISG